MESSSQKTLPVSPCEALVADISTLAAGHAVCQRLSHVHQLPLPDPHCRPQTIAFAGTDEALQLWSHFPIHVNPSVYIRTHTRFAL